MPERKLLKNGCVLSLDSKVGNFMQADVLIDGSKIAAVGPNLSASVGDAEIIDAANMIVMPGFVDSHRHIWEGILRNIGTDLPLEGDVSYVSIILNTLAPVYRPDDVYAGNMVGILGAIDAGITCMLDWADIQQTPEHAEAGIRALKDSGIRAVFAYGGPSGIESDPHQDEWFRDIAKKHFSSKDQLLTLGCAASGPDGPLEMVKRQWQLARELDARISVHVGVGKSGQQGKLAELGRAGLLKDDTTYIHCTTLNDEEIGMIVDTGGTVSIAAPVEMMMGHGLVPTQEFLNRGLRPSLSVDVETNVPGDMFTQMRSVISLQRAFIFDQKLNGSRNQPAFLNARDVLEFATVEGARANGLLDKIGTLTPGKEADIIMLRMNMINVMPVNDPIGAVVWGMDTSNVDSV
ncbi:MAG: amidohydrolase family protein, partial [Burkholderiales bacterium]|nr:amidohydrolase family protein [Anaerolineae bacterium]